MPLPVLTAPPLRTPLVDQNGFLTPAWQKWIDLIWRKTGAETNVAPISIEGSAAVATQANTIVTTQASGSPEGVEPAPPGSFYIDTDTGTTYVKQEGDDEIGWISL